MLTKSVESPSNPSMKMPQYLPGDILPCTILIIYWKVDFLDKFNLNLGYILIKLADLNNKDNGLYKKSFSKLIEISQNNNFVIIEIEINYWVYY